MGNQKLLFFLVLTLSPLNNYFSAVWAFSSSSIVIPPRISFNHPRTSPQPPKPRSNAISKRRTGVKPLSISPSNNVVASGLIFSTIIGLISDRKVGGGYGIIMSMISASILSNWNILPNAHPLYDYCWRIYLPSSLTLLLMTLPRKKSQSSQIVKKLMPPFFIACLGSVIGCSATFFLPILSNKKDAALGAACLCASYIGGSFNFWETGRILSGGKSMEGVLAALAASDIVVMAIYFAGLAVALNYKPFQKYFGFVERDGDGKDDEDEVRQQRKSMTFPQRISAVFSSLILANVITRLSQRMESFVNITGISSAIICIMTPMIFSSLSKFFPVHSLHISSVSPFLSSMRFHIFFASIGASIDVSTSIIQAPSAFLFASISLIIHVLFLFGVSALFCRKKWLLQDLLIASNAAIGGPVTAATFAGNQCRLGREYVIGATFCGVVGYGVGTTLGVQLFEIFKQWC